MSEDQLREAWVEIRRRVEGAAEIDIRGVLWHDRPYGIDAAMLSDVLDYVDDVLAGPTVSFTPAHLNLGD